MFRQLAIDIETFFIEQIQPQTEELDKVFFDNVNGSGNNGSGDNGDLVWVRHAIQEDDRNYNALGRKNTRVHGVVTLQIFTKKGEGAQLSNTVADTFDSYTGVCAGSARFQPPLKTFSGTNGDWYQQTYIIRFYSDETRS